MNVYSCLKTMSISSNLPLTKPLSSAHQGCILFSALQTWSITIKGDCQQGGAVLPRVRAPSCQHTTVESRQHESAKRSCQGLSTDTFSFSLTWISINHLHKHSEIYSHKFSALIESLHRDTNTNHRKCSINTTRSKWYVRNGWPHSASAGPDQVSWGLFEKKKKNRIGQGVQRIIYPRPPWTRQRNLFTIIWLLSFFGGQCTQHFRE